MVVRKFYPYGNNRNGIIKYIFPTNKSDEIDLKYYDVDRAWSHIYPTAFLEDNKNRYYQSVVRTAYLNMTFKRSIFLTHYAMSAYNVNSKGWCYPRNFEISACRDDSCNIIDSHQDSDILISGQMNLVPVVLGTVNSIRITMSNCSCGFIALERFEIFGYLCDSLDECKWKNIINLNTYKIKRHLHISMFLTSILITS